jgi:DNA-binding transcriptional ArsR family regulator
MTKRKRSGEDDLLVALRHPLRRQILQRMAQDEPISPRELSDALDQPLSNVSYHVRVLDECGTVSLVEEKPVRGSMQHFYRVSIDERWALRVLGLPAEEGKNSEG